MPKKELGNKCLVDTFKIYESYDGTNEISDDCSIVVEMDGFSWESNDYTTLEEFLQVIINHAHNVSMGKE